MTDRHTTLIGLDWGTSRVRAYRFDECGAVAEERTQPWGVLAAPGADFPAAFRALTAGWTRDAAPLPVIACGMIGSTEGWLPAPYCACPAGVAELAAACTPSRTEAGLISVVPGVEAHRPVPDVMRGEETQIAGALALRPALAAAATFVLPGTHAKWVDVRDARIVRFTTYMTGELYALLSEHSILGRPASRTSGPSVGPQTGSWDAFDRGVRAARDNDSRGVAPLLFQTRSLVLAKQLDASESLHFLSGLLIGDEVVSGLGRAAGTIALVGAAPICARYERALAACGVTAEVIDAAAPAGLWRIACRAGLVAGAQSHV